MGESMLLRMKACGLCGYHCFECFFFLHIGICLCNHHTHDLHRRDICLPSALVPSCVLISRDVDLDMDMAPIPRNKLDSVLWSGSGSGSGSVSGSGCGCMTITISSAFISLHLLPAPYLSFSLLCSFPFLSFPSFHSLSFPTSSSVFLSFPSFLLLLFFHSFP